MVVHALAFLGRGRLTAVGMRCYQRPPSTIQTKKPDDQHLISSAFFETLQSPQTPFTSFTDI